MVHMADFPLQIADETPTCQLFRNIWGSWRRLILGQNWQAWNFRVSLEGRPKTKMTQAEKQQVPAVVLG